MSARLSSRRKQILLGFVALSFSSLSSSGSAEHQQIVDVPENDAGEQTLEARRDAQLETIGDFQVFHDFRFSDRVEESGITFSHQIVDDAGKHYKAAHYDHGNGISIADVDGDGLYDIYFLTQLGANELWRNLGGGKFEEITDRAGVGLPERISVAASFGDIDNDGDEDLFVTTVRMGNALFENDGNGSFTDISSRSGLDYVGHSSGAAFLDFDNDGLLDLFVTNVGKYTTEEQGRGGYYVAFEDAFQGHLKPERAERSILYENLGNNSFVDVSESVALMDTSWSGDVSIANLNNDDYPDLYLTNMQGDDHYYENVRGQVFFLRTASYFPKTPWGAMGINFFDYNNDGHMDLLITDMHSDMSKEVIGDEEYLKPSIENSEMFFDDSSNNILGNAFYENGGDGTFIEISDEIGAENYWPWGVSVGDLNADGFEDVFIASSMNYSFRYGINSILLNNNGDRFLRSEFILGIEPRKDGRTRTPWFVLDCSGEDESHSRCADRDGLVQIRGTLGTRSSAIFDLDNDGDLDIVTNEFNSEPQVLVSNLSEQTQIRFLGVRLRGTLSNRDGLGATVRVFAGSKTLTKLNDGKSGYLSHSSTPLYFGLGDAEIVDRIEVLWPSGTRQEVPGPIATNQLLEVVEQED